MYCRMRAGAVLCVLSAELVVIPVVALGQAAGPGNSSGQIATESGQGTGAGELAEIIVTAQKRQQSINTVGMAITAAAATQLQDMGIDSVSGLAKLDPSVVVSQSLYGAPVYAIRGVAYNDYSLAASPTVSVYTDEVPYPYLALAKAVSFDVERVELLKGPQGTLFGQNATGGAVNYIAAKPTSTLAMGFGTSYDSFGAAGFNGFISGPISATLRGRLAFDIHEGGAWQESISRIGDKLGDKDQKRVRGILEWLPTDNLKVALNVTGWTDHSDTQTPQAIGITPELPGTYPNTPFANPALAGRTYASLIGLTPVPIPTDDKQAEWQPGFRPRLDEQAYQASLRVEYSLSDDLSLTYVGSYQHYRQQDLYDNYGNTVQLNYDDGGRVESGYNELRLSGKQFDSALNWVIGADYSLVRADEQQFNRFLSTNQYALIQLPVLLHLSTSYLDPFRELLDTSIDHNRSKAVFGNVEYRVLPALSFHGGVRYNTTDITHSGCSQDVDGNLAAGFNDLLLARGLRPATPIPQGGCITLGPTGIPGIQTATLDQNNVSWRVGADWTPVQRTLLYATVSKGFKSGNFPTLAASDYVQLRPVTQESVLAYEVGVKSTIAAARLEVDGALFYYDYRDKQLEGAVVDPLHIFGVLTALVNVPKSREEGAELALKYRPIPDLALTASATYIDSAVTSDFFSYNPYSTTSTINLKGEPFPNTPKWSGRLGGQYNWDVLSGRYSAYLGFDAAYTSESQGQFGNASGVAEGFPSLEIKAYGTLDLRAGLDSNDGKWRFQVFGRNVTNTYYWTQAIRAYETAVRFAGQPASVGASVTYRY
jgi:iron complex outermembrane receptor protein